MGERSLRDAIDFCSSKNDFVYSLSYAHTSHQSSIFLFPWRDFFFSSPFFGRVTHFIFFACLDWQGLTWKLPSCFCSRGEPTTSKQLFFFPPLQNSREILLPAPWKCCGKLGQPKLRKAPNISRLFYLSGKTTLTFFILASWWPFASPIALFPCQRVTKWQHTTSPCNRKTSPVFLAAWLLPVPYEDSSSTIQWGPFHYFSLLPSIPSWCYWSGAELKSEPRKRKYSISVGGVE